MVFSFIHDLFSLSLNSGNRDMNMIAQQITLNKTIMETKYFKTTLVLTFRCPKSPLPQILKWSVWQRLCGAPKAQKASRLSKGSGGCSVIFDFVGL